MFKLPKLPYPYNALEPYIDARTMEIHHKKHHAGYVDKLNNALKEHKKISKKSLTKLLASLDKFEPASQIALEQAGGGHYNHSLFWKIMTPNQKTRLPSGKLARAITKHFGNFDKFKTNFSEIALKIFGSGWAWLATDDRGHLCVCATKNQLNPLMPGQFKCADCEQNCRPILCLDVWEHAYYLRYQNRRADYIKAWWNVVNWSAVEKLFLDNNKRNTE